MPRKLPRNGITPPLVTPLLGPEKLDRKAFERIINRTIDAGVTGLFVLGTTGEGPSLSTEFKWDVVGECCDLVDRRVPLLVGLIDASTEDSFRLAEYAATEGADALVLTPPFYYPLSQDDVLRWAERLIPRLPLPVYLYNIPVFTQVPFEPETLARLAQIPQVCGIKDSGGDLKKLARTRELLPDMPILWGPEEVLLEAMAAGATGGVNGGANLFPELFVALHDAIAAGHQARARTLQDLVARIGREIYGAAPGGPGFVFGVKCALEDLGVANALPAEPLTILTGPAREQIRLATNAIAALAAEI
ncbi:MAG: dihydrodipicolinate synthase family protein [Bryobacterales bacterium]|nr:dihydrodipicolinate synthase family protein [Bryobacterales bacterium]